MNYTDINRHQTDKTIYNYNQISTGVTKYEILFYTGINTFANIQYGILHHFHLHLIKYTQSA